MASNYPNGISRNSQYNVDIVFCIDVTGSMEKLIKLVQKNVSHFYKDVQSAAKRANKHIDVFRVRLIAFRDYLADNDDAMYSSEFFTLPDDNVKFQKCVNSLVALGGDDDQEDGLEALAFAIRSKWNNSSKKKRHLIVLWTDDDAHDLGFGKESPAYPVGMAVNIRDLTAWWGDYDAPGFMDQDAKRLILFAPAKPHWLQISKGWNKVLHVESQAGQGLSEFDYEQVIDAILRTVT